MRMLLALCAIAGCWMGAASAEEVADFHLANHAGKVVYLDFWASWCTPCRASFPWMQEMQAKYAEQGLQVIAVNVDRDRAAAERFLAEQQVAFPIVFDPEGQLAGQYDLLGMPSSFLFARDGHLLSEHSGFRAKDRMALENAMRVAVGAGGS